MEKLLYKDFVAGFKEYDDYRIKHHHDTYEIFLVMSGKMDITRQSKQYRLNSGYVFLCTPDFEHSYTSRNTSKCYSITFSVKFLEMFFTPQMRRTLTHCFTSEVIRLKNEEIEKFIELYNMMVSEWEKGILTYPLHLANIMYLFIGASERHEKEPILPEYESKEKAAVINVITYVNSNYRSIESLDEVAEACFISKSYMCHVFKSEYKMTVMEYLKRVRIRHACEFLATSDKTFSLIATKMGFADLSHFTKNFKSIMGCSPREYRNSRKSERIQAETRENRTLENR